MALFHSQTRRHNIMIKHGYQYYTIRKSFSKLNPRHSELNIYTTISQFCALTLKKDPKLNRNDPQTSPVL